MSIRKFIMFQINKRINVGEVMPWWAAAIFHILHPILFIFLHQRAIRYDFSRGILIFNKEEIDIRVLECMTTPDPNLWFRVMRNERGMIYVQTKTERGMIGRIIPNTEISGQ